MSLLARLRPTPDEIVGGVALLSVEFVVVLAYLLVTGRGIAPSFLLLVALPFVWINVALWALVRVRPPETSLRRRFVAGTLGLGYFLLLAYTGGLLLPGIGDLATGWRVVLLAIPPGWAPAVLYSGERIVVNLIPYQVVGYATLAYLVYVTVLDASGGVAAGLLGLFSCVSCSLPIIAAIVGGLFGSAGGVLVSAANAQSYGLSTFVFLLTVALLAWRPTMGDFSTLRAKVGV